MRSHSTAPGVAARLVSGCILVAIVLALFWPALGHPFIAFDDVGYILQNPEVNGGAATSPIDRLLTPTVGYVVPVTVNLQAALFALSAGDAMAFHLAALLLHALIALQLLGLGLRLGASLQVAFASTLLWVVHPLCVQPVAWAICLKDLLMASFVLGATRLFIRVADLGEERVLRSACCALLLALLAMLSKPSAVLVGLAWVGYLWSRRLSGDVTALPAQRVALWCCLLGACVGLGSRFAHDTLTQAAADPAWSLAFVPAVLGRQLSHLLWPADLLITYANPSGAMSDPYAVAGTLALGLLLWLGIRLRRRPAPMLMLGLAVSSYLPTSNLLPFARVISDSYMYLPLCCLALCAALCIDAPLRRAPGWMRYASVALAALIGCALSIASARQLPRYRGGDALWKPVIDAYPRLAEAHRLYADELMFLGQPARAVVPYQRSLSLRYDPRYLMEFGTVLSLSGQLQDAECVLIEAAAHGDAPGYAAHNYAALMAFNPDYDSHHPIAGKALLQRIDRLRRSGQVPWPQKLLPGLQAQLQKLHAARGEPLAWPRRNCRVLRPPPE